MSQMMFLRYRFHPPLTIPPDELVRLNRILNLLHMARKNRSLVIMGGNRKV